MMLLDLDNLNNEQTKQYNEIFTANLNDYTEFVDEQSAEFSGNIKWWLTFFASRDTMISTVPSDIAKILLAKNYYESEEDVVVKTQSKAVASALYSFMPKDKVSLSSANTGLAKRVKDTIIRCRDFLGIVRRLYSWKTDADRYAKDVSAKSFDNITLLSTDIFAWNYKDGKCTLRDFVDFDKHCNMDDVYICPIYFANTRSEQAQLINNISNEKHYNMIMREWFLKKSDYLELLFMPINMRAFCKNSRRFKGIDVSELINEEIKRSSLSKVSMIGLLEYKAIHRMKKAGVTIKRALAWYEAQPSSRGLFAAIRKCYPMCSTLGYVAYPLDGTLYGVVSGKEDLKQKIVPEEMGVMSDYFLDFPRKLSDKVITKTVPAFRMQKALDAGIKSDAQDANQEIQNSILVVLSYGTNISNHIINLLEENAAYFKENNIKLILKNHPARLNDAVADYGIDNPKNEYSFVGGTMDEAVRNAGTVIFSQSGSGFEVMIMGKPLIAIVPPSAILQTYLPDALKNDKYYTAYTSKDIINALDRIYSGDFTPLGNVEEYIARTDERLMNNLLK